MGAGGLYSAILSVVNRFDAWPLGR